jgi:hypothetical protein
MYVWTSHRISLPPSLAPSLFIVLHTTFCLGGEARFCLLTIAFLGFQQEVHAQFRAAAAVIGKEHGLGDSSHYMSLSEIPNCPLLPTLNGWLLSYPAVYLVDAENVTRAANALSEEALHLHELHMTSPVLEVGLPYSMVRLRLSVFMWSVVNLGFDKPQCMKMCLLCLITPSKMGVI